MNVSSQSWIILKAALRRRAQISTSSVKRKPVRVLRKCTLAVGDFSFLSTGTSPEPFLGTFLRRYIATSVSQDVSNTFSAFSFTHAPFGLASIFQQLKIWSTFRLPSQRSYSSVTPQLLRWTSACWNVVACSVPVCSSRRNGDSLRSFLHFLHPISKIEFQARLPELLAVGTRQIRQGTCISHHMLRWLRVSSNAYLYGVTALFLVLRSHALFLELLHRICP